MDGPREGGRRRRGGGRGSGKGEQAHQQPHGQAPQHNRGAVAERQEQQHAQKQQRHVDPAAPVAVADGPKGTKRTSEDFLCPTSRYSTTEAIHPLTRQALAEKFGYDRMTKVQAATIPLAIQGDDILAKAQTGTGKTLAFLIPAIETIVKIKSQQAGRGIRSVVLSPTRELAAQIHTECQQLLAFHRNMSSAVVYGGTSMGKDVKVLNQSPDILVATPGRLLDHLQNTAGVKELILHCNVFTLDEADRMLEMGFRHDLEKIMAFLPKQRQTLLFSATVPAEIVRIAPRIMSSEFSFVDAGTGEITKATADDGKHDKSVRKLEADNPLKTAAQVAQNAYVAPIADHFGLGLHLVEKEIQEKSKAKESYKIIAFFTTARQTQLWAELFNLMGVSVLEVHSRKSQAQRTKASDAFRDGSNVIMFSSDVTARGMDYPDVTFVLQVGVPADAEQYVHRLGRTGRAGKQGHGSLILAPEEQFFLHHLSKLPLKMRNADQDVGNWTPFRERVSRGLHKLPADTKGKAYQAWLGFYNGFSGKMKWSKEELVRRANSFAMDVLLLPSPPGLLKKTIGMMGLKGVPGLVIDAAPQFGGGGRQQQPQKRDRSPPRFADKKRDRTPPSATQPPKSGGGGGGRGGGGGGRGRGGPRGQRPAQ